jgi:hypothetical protein
LAPGSPRAFLAWNAGVILLPFWVTGVRSILRNHSLVVKCEMMLGLERRLEGLGDGIGPAAKFQYQIQTAAAKNEVGEVPVDVKGVVRFPGGAEEFLGVQLQVAINEVDGTSYPYFYAVLVARPGFGGMQAEHLMPPPSNVLLEESKEADVSILVIRQKTTQRAGYHTNPGVVRRIFEYAVGQARWLLRGEGGLRAGGGEGKSVPADGPKR